MSRKSKNFDLGTSVIAENVKELEKQLAKKAALRGFMQTFINKHEVMRETFEKALKTNGYTYAISYYSIDIIRTETQSDEAHKVLGVLDMYVNIEQAIQAVRNYITDKESELLSTASALYTSGNSMLAQSAALEEYKALVSFYTTVENYFI